MAAAAPSPLASSVEKTNGAKLSRLLIDGGTTVLRNVFDRYHPPTNLAASLNANYPTLNSLKTRRVLHKPQWDLLFPPGGGTPDSKTFDITLLFLLLSNICGLSPPLSGWHKPPPSSDTSLEANLTRIKLYRNELYGHLTSTGVQTAVFNVKWQGISTVLVSLGLNPVELVRLKSEPCGEDYISALIEWNKSDEEIKSQLGELRKRQQEASQMQAEDHKILQDTHQAFQDSLKTLEKHLESLQAVKQAVDSLKEGKDAGAEQQVLQNLAKSEFKGDIEYLVERYQEGTREWVFNEVENWLDDRNSENRVMVISSNAGMGKSVISAVICKRMQEAGRLLGSHFCQHNNARYRNPQLMLQSLACHLYHALPEYEHALVKQLSRTLGKDLNSMGVEELFALLFKEPLSTVADPGKHMLVVIDGLDESDYQERNELLDVLANLLCKLPCWIRFLCTTRPERNIAEALKHLKPFQLESNDDKNMEDIKRFIENRTRHLIKPEKEGFIVEKLVEKSEGLMLYAYFLVLFIEENKSVLDQGNLLDSLPLAISSAYHSYFKRLENELKKEEGVKEEDFLNLLSAVIASREPMPIDFVSKLLGPNASSPLARRKVLKAISSVSSLLPIRDGCLHVIHKSVKDWLTDTSCYGEHDFTIDEKDGHRILASLCGYELDNLKQKGFFDAQFSATENYALHHGVRHMLQLEENMGSRSVEKCVQTYVTDLVLLYRKISVNNSIPAEEILWLQSQELFPTLSANTRDSLNTLMLLLRKHLSTFTDHPHVVFQTLLNEGGPVLSPIASNILQHKYPEIPYLEFLNKKTQQGAVLARFQCSYSVACFDVSPQLDYMVCECTFGTLQLWSLRTGELLWTRPVRVKKRYTGHLNSSEKIYRPSVFSTGVLADVMTGMSFYRSVVFYPTEKVVLPGILSHAYDFNGDLKPFFPESHCSFTVCSISGDKSMILTDCPDDSKCIIIWSLKNGSEISRITREEKVLSFAWSRDGKLLAISHVSGRIAIVDAVDGFRTLAQTDLRKVCGMIRFSPDSRSLLCVHISLATRTSFTIRLNITIAEHVTCRVDVLKEPCVTWEFESRSEGGFLLGDPLSCVVEGEVGGNVSHLNFDFVLDKHTVLRRRGVGVEMLNINQRHQSKKEVSREVLQIVFSLSGEIIYVARCHRFSTTTVTAWNVSRSELIAEKKVDVLQSSRNCLLPVKGGVLIVSGMCNLQMWNFELSKCVGCWTNMASVTDVFPISGERMACTTKERKVIILNTTSKEILSTIQIGPTSYFLACNSKFQILTLDKDDYSLCLSDRKTTLWEKPCHGKSFGRFSPAETFVISCSEMWNGAGIVVHDAVSGNTLHVLCRTCPTWSVCDCQFVSDEECVVISKSTRLEQWRLQLFNIKSGDLLSNLSHSDLQLNKLWTRGMNCVAASPCMRLIAVHQSDSKHGYELIRVRLPGDEDSRESKWILNPGEHRKVQKGEQEKCSCLQEYYAYLQIIQMAARRDLKLRGAERINCNDDDDADDDDNKQYLLGERATSE